LAENQICDNHLPGTITDTSKPLPGRRNEYAYDTIGNRTSSGRNGVAGTEEEYTSNALNQIATRENHAVPFAGTAAPDALVKVAGSPVLAGRQGAYWYDETTVPNISGPYRGTRYALAKPAGQNVVRIDGRIVTLAQALQSFTYDPDGNLTQDGIWTYTWDAEGRLVAMAATPSAVAAGFVEQTLRFAYDHLGRRVRKEVFGEGSALVSRTVWIYDGWNMIAEYDQPAIGGSLALKRSYAWGLDLLGSLRASGGIGALLQLRDYSENATYLAGYDGNGNLTTLQNAATGTLAATYEYGPYGEPIATSGAYADKNPLRFSTKYTDDETGLVSFGRRYYDPRNGRFLGRDPIEERGGRNLYGFVGNEPINHGDRLGMETFLIWASILDKFGNPTGQTHMTEADYSVPGLGGGILGPVSESLRFWQWVDRLAGFFRGVLGPQAYPEDKADEPAPEVVLTDAEAAAELARIFKFPTKKDKDRAISLAVQVYKIDVSGVKSIEFDGTLEDGLRGLATPDRRIRIGWHAFSDSPGRLGATIAHEAEIHIRQFKENRALPSLQSRAYNEVEAYQFNLDTADRFNLTAEEVTALQEKYIDWYGKLNAANKVFADRREWDKYDPTELSPPPPAPDPANPIP